MPTSHFIPFFSEDKHLCRAFPANTLICSSGDLRSRSAAELLLMQKTKLPCRHDGLLEENPTPCSQILFQIKNTQR
jgi:hypothetical protein